jgi:HPt (histidine-containing phosphotransfer) domain-containing protein
LASTGRVAGSDSQAARKLWLQRRTATEKLCQLIEHQLRSGVPAEELEPEFLELLDEMDNVTRDARKMMG